MLVHPSMWGGRGFLCAVCARASCVAPVWLLYVPSRRGVLGVRAQHLILFRSQGKVDITNSYAVPFEERGDTWYLDHAYLTSMFQMFKKVAGSWLRCVLVGMYALAPLIACAP